MSREEFSFRHKLIDESGTVHVEAGNVQAQAGGRIQVGIVELEGTADGGEMKLSGSAKVSTVEADASASAGMPGAGASASAHAAGPSAQASGEVGLDRMRGKVGVSAGEASGRAGVTLFGESFDVGAKVGLKAELGAEWGPTSTIELPLISISGPNPVAAASQFALNAAKSLARNPLGTTEQAAGDLLAAARDATESLDEAIEFVGGLFADDIPEERTTTNDNWDTSGQPAPPGRVKFD
jgi:hypothetical protein